MIALMLAITLIRAVSMLGVPLFLLLYVWYDYLEYQQTPYAWYALVSGVIYIGSSLLFWAIERGARRHHGELHHR